MKWIMCPYVAFNEAILGHLYIQELSLCRVHCCNLEEQAKA